jgi:hypothetical protein
MMVLVCNVGEIVFALCLELCVKIVKRHYLATCLPLETIFSLRYLPSVLQEMIVRMLTAQHGRRNIRPSATSLVSHV